MLFGHDPSGFEGTDVGLEARSGGAPIQGRHHVDGPLMRAVGTRQRRVEERQKIFDAALAARKVARRITNLAQVLNETGLFGLFGQRSGGKVTGERWKGKRVKDWI